MNFEVIDSVKDVINSIIESENYETPPEVTISSDFQEGNGYASKSYAITIKGKNKDPQNIFIKYLPDQTADSAWKKVIIQTYKTEFKFYSEVYPTFCRLQNKKRNIKQFNNIPKHYKTNIDKFKVAPIVLENLKCLGYVTRDRKKPADDVTMKLALKALAEYHAFSYALKDLEPAVFEELCVGAENTFSQFFQPLEMDVATKLCTQQFVDTLDPVVDKEMLDQCQDLGDKIVQFALKLSTMTDKYFVLDHGDCWINNMMFLFDDKTGLPIDIKIIDWQTQRLASPLLDFSYFFYTFAQENELDQTKMYLDFYYKNLSERIEELGGDANKMYPYEIFMEHWKKFALYGLCMALSVIKAQLFEKDEYPSLIEGGSCAGFGVVLKHQDVYVQRIRDLVQHFIRNKLL